MLQLPPSSIESKTSWIVATVALVTMLMAFGAAWITAVALKDIAAEVNGIRSIPALASALAWLGSGFGGILMGRIADKVGTRWTVICGSLMIGLGLAISTIGPPWPLWIGHGLFIGLIGLGGINAPMYIYVSRWFDRRRGSALALISSGSYLAGAMWPPVFERAIAAFGWRQAMLWYALAEIVVIIPLALLYFRAPPELILPTTSSDPAAGKARVLGWPPNLVFGMMCVAAVLCCVPMAMPQGHLVAFCSDLGITRSNGALMLSVLLGTAFLSRQIWGAISDRHRRARDRPDRLGMAVCVDDGISFHPKRSGPVHDSSGVRPRILRDHPGLRAGIARIVSRVRGLVAHSDIASL
jgi:MFS family permease